jgi:hypothetical protein
LIILIEWTDLIDERREFLRLAFAVDHQYSLQQPNPVTCAKDEPFDSPVVCTVAAVVWQPNCAWLQLYISAYLKCMSVALQPSLAGLEELVDLGAVHVHLHRHLWQAHHRTEANVRAAQLGIH